MAIPALQDQLAYSAIDLMDIVHQMELETIVQDLSEYTYDFDKMSIKLNNMREILHWAQEELYDKNNHAISLMFPTYKDTERQPLYFLEEDEKEFEPEEVIELVNKVIAEHQEIFARVAKSANEILRYGAPSDSVLGQMIDKVRNIDEIKQENKEAMAELVSKQVTIDYLRTFACHSLRRQAASNLAVLVACQENPERFAAENPVECRTKAQQCLAALKYTEEQFKNMTDRENDMLLANTTLSIKKVGDGTYSVTVTQAQGTKREAEISGDGVEYKETEERQYSKHSYSPKFGKNSGYLKMTKETKYGVLYGDKEESEIVSHKAKKENEKIKTLKERIFGELNYTKTRSHKARGKKSLRAELKLNTVRFKNKKSKIYKIKGKTKEKDLSNVAVTLMGGAASIATPEKGEVGTAVFTAKVDLAQVQAGWHGLELQAGAGASASVGEKRNVKDIAKTVAQILAGELANGSSANLTKVVESITSMLNAISPDSNINLGNLTFLVHGTNLIEIQVEEPSEEWEQKLDVNITSPVVDKLKEMEEDFEEALDMLQEKAEAPVQENSSKQEPQPNIAQNMFAFADNKKESACTIVQTTWGDKDQEEIEWNR